MFFAVFIDVFDDDLYDDDAGDGKEHAGGAENFTTEDDAQHDGNRMQVEGFADEGRIDDVMIDLGEDDVEQHRLQCQPGGLGGSQDGTEGRSDGRSEYWNELADTGYDCENRGVGDAAQSKVQENDGAGNQTDDQLAADIGVQGLEDPIEEGKDTGVISMRKEMRDIAFDGLSVFEQVEGDEQDDDEIDEFVKGGNKDGQR